MVKLFVSPGPKYGAPTTIGSEKTDPRIPRAPAYTMGQLLQIQQQDRLPGPKYDLSNITRHGPAKTTGATLLAARSQKRNEPIPGPDKYNVVPCMPITMPSMPMYSIGAKRIVRKKLSIGPAPNKYLLATTVGYGPMYSIQGRHAEPGGGRRAGNTSSPGPAKYSAVPLERFSLQTPRAVMLGRPADGPDHSSRRTPGPNVYNPGPAAMSRYDNAPQFSIAGRYPERAAPYYTAADLVPDWESEC